MGSLWLDHEYVQKKNEGPWKADIDRIEDDEEDDEETDEDDSDCDQDYHDDWEKEKQQQKDCERESDKKEEEADNWADKQSYIILRLGQRRMDSSLFHPVHSTPEERLRKLEEDLRSPTIEVETPAENQLLNPVERIKQVLLPDFYRHFRLISLIAVFSPNTRIRVGTAEAKDQFRLFYVDFETAVLREACNRDCLSSQMP